MTSLRRTALATTTLVLLLTIWYVIHPLEGRIARFTVKFIDIEGISTLDPIAINDSGQVLIADRQNWGKPSFKIRALIWKDGTLTEICPECQQVIASGLNNHGEVVGQFIGSDNKKYHPFFWNGEGGLVDLFRTEMISASEETRLDWMTAINDRGQILVQRDTLFLVDPKGEMSIKKRQNFPAFLVTSSSGSIRFDRLQEDAWYSDLNNQGTVLGNSKSGPLLVTTDSIEDVHLALTGSDIFIGKEINNQGQVLGVLSASEEDFPFPMYEFGKTALWSPIDGLQTVADMEIGRPSSLSDSGIVVGASIEFGNSSKVASLLDDVGFQPDWLPKTLRYTEEEIIHPWIYREGNLEEFNLLLPDPLEWIGRGVVDINNRGQILGMTKKNGKDVLVILTQIEDSSREE